MEIMFSKLSFQGLKIVPIVLLLLPSTIGLLQSSNLVIDENNDLLGDPTPLSFMEAVQLLHNNPEHFYTEDKEQSRMISITNGGVYRGDLVFYLPITVLLPTLAFGSKYTNSGRKSSSWYQDLFGRSFSDRSFKFNDVRGIEDKVEINDLKYDPDLIDYQCHKDFGPILSRLDAYFHYLGVHDEACKSRTICELIQNQEIYTPVSQLFLTALKKSESFARPETYLKPVFRFYKYYWASETGDEGKDCSMIYSDCPAGASDVINMNMLKLWQRLAPYLSIKLSDE